VVEPLNRASSDLTQPPSSPSAAGRLRPIALYISSVPRSTTLLGVSPAPTGLDDVGGAVGTPAARLVGEQDGRARDQLASYPHAAFLATKDVAALVLLGSDGTLRRRRSPRQGRRAPPNPTPGRRRTMPWVCSWRGDRNSQLRAVLACCSPQYIVARTAYSTLG